jgi:hypothetical protein
MGRAIWTLAGAAAAVALWLLIRAVVANDPAWTPQVVEIASPALPRASSEPRLSASGTRAILSWIERHDDRASLKFAERLPSGWSTPQVVASGDDWFLNWADVPSVVRLADGMLAAHWLQSNGPDPEGYDIQLSFSTDEGRTWRKPMRPHHDGTATEHGFASLFNAPGGGLGIVWLDGRQTAADAHGGASGDMALRATSFSTDGVQRSESVVDDRVCECCPTAAVATADGGVVAAFRDRAKDERRDIAISRLEGGTWTSPVPVHDDNWRIDACPVNGPALAAIDRQVAVAWFNAKSDQGHAFVAFSSDAGRTFGAPVRVDDQASLGRVAVEMLEDGSAAVGWIEYAEERAQFRVRRVTAAGRQSTSTIVSGLASSRASGYPRLARAGRELIFAWTETANGVSSVHTASTRLER